MTDFWWQDLVDPMDLPPRAEMEARAAALLKEAEGWLREAAERRLHPDAIRSTREAVEEWIREENTDHPQAVHTAWPQLDGHLGRPIRAGELILIAARPGVGKTWALQSWIEATLKQDTEACAVLFELEMLAWHLAERLATHALQVTPNEARKQAREGLTADDVMRASPALERLVISESGVSVEQLPEAIEAATEKLGRRPTVVAVDYLGLLRWDGAVGARTYERASENAKLIKAVARRERVALIAAAQMSRGAGDGTSRPTLDDLRDSGVVEEAADRVIAFWRPTPIDEEDRGGVVVASAVEIGCAVLKNRFGPTGGTLDLIYDHALRLVEAGYRRRGVQQSFPDYEKEKL